MALVAASQVVAAADAPRRLELELDPHGAIRWDRGGTPVLAVWPRPGDGWIVLAERYCGSAAAAPAVRAANPGLAAPQRDRTVAIPVERLRPELRLAAVRGLFPADQRVAEGWRHWALDPFGGGEEGWSWLAALFTGRADGGSALRAANSGHGAAVPQRGRPITVPAELLLPVFLEQPLMATPTPSATLTPAATVVPSASGESLTYGEDAQGRYAEYRLRRGEALYSAVVVRFTGQMYAQQVNATAAEIARRSGIRDVTTIPISYPIKIPLDLLLPRYLPPGDAARLDWEREQRELAGFLEVVRATSLSGVQVIIDAGHGGADTGAVVDGMWEASYAYDVGCRIRANLEQHTKAKVWMTRQDTARGFAVPEQDRLPQTRGQVLLTRPPYRLEDSTLGVHLRWYLTNDIILKRLAPEVPRSKTVFVSIHADSLHPSLRGTMVYVPSRHLRPNEYTVERRDIRRYAEYRAHPTVRFGTEFKARVEASSRHLAASIIRTLDGRGLVVHSEEPVRDRVLRGRRSWVPAVLCYTAAQNAILVECCNMANQEDRRQLADRRWREEFARGVVEGMAAAFSGG